MRGWAQFGGAALWAAAAVLLSAEPRPTARDLPAGVRPVPTTHLHNTFQLTTNVFSGSSPDDEGGFAELARMGVKTIISVDGVKPKVELARNHGMRYVHLPHGYDGIDSNVQAQLVKAAQLSGETVFVHCHHGLHRGPAAAAIICMANGGWSPVMGEAWLKAAGTGSNYAGLYESVRHFQQPSEERLRAMPSTFPEVAKVPGLVEAMVGIDERWDHLKAARKAGYQRPKEHPDIDPAHEAVLLRELYRESERLRDAGRHGARFVQLLTEAETNAKEAETLLRAFAAAPTPEARARLDKAFEVMGANCSACHNVYRDRH